MYLRTTYCPCANIRVALHVRKDVEDAFYIDAEPYVLRDVISGTTGRAGAKIAVGKHFNHFDIELFHESVHSLDAGFGMPYEMDGIQMHGILSK